MAGTRPAMTWERIADARDRPASIRSEVGSELMRFKKRESGTLGHQLKLGFGRAAFAPALQAGNRPSPPAPDERRGTASSAPTRPGVHGGSLNREARAPKSSRTII